MQYDIEHMNQEELLELLQKLTNKYEEAIAKKNMQKVWQYKNMLKTVSNKYEYNKTFWATSQSKIKRNKILDEIVEQTII